MQRLSHRNLPQPVRWYILLDAMLHLACSFHAQEAASKHPHSAARHAMASYVLHCSAVCCPWHSEGQHVHQHLRHPAVAARILHHPVLTLSTLPFRARDLLNLQP